MPEPETQSPKRLPLRKPPSRVDDKPPEKPAKPPTAAKQAPPPPQDVGDESGEDTTEPEDPGILDHPLAMDVEDVRPVNPRGEPEGELVHFDLPVLRPDGAEGPDRAPIYGESKYPKWNIPKP